jgi:magnesium chelatase subunit D
VKQSQLRGRPIGTRAGDPRSGARLNLVETLRTAAPWQRLRRRETEQARAADPDRKAPRVDVRKDDFRVNRYKQRTETTTIFVVDASGSAALHRLAEAKGAVNLLLADCYVRRDRVALLAFRGTGADLLLPPTNSLVRAKRSLAGLPGGGGTPIAAAIGAALELADAVRRRGQTPIVVLMTDGRGNIARDGKPDRPRAEADALVAASQLRAARITSLLVDMSPRPHPAAKKLAAEMGAQYLPLPYADAAMLSKAVRAKASE